MKNLTFILKDLSQTQVENINDSLNFISDLFLNKWSSVFELYLNKMYKERVEFNKDEFDMIADKFRKNISDDLNLNKNNVLENINNLKRLFSTDKNEYHSLSLNKDEVFYLCEILDAYIRVALGQWDRLNNLLNFKMIFDDVNELKNLLLIYKTRNNFGIYSNELSDNIRIIYDIYKTLMFERGVKGVYEYEPELIAEYKNTKFLVSTNKDIKIIFSGMKVKDFTMLIGSDNVRYFKGSDIPWVNIDNKSSVKKWVPLEKGMKFLMKYNGQILLLEGETYEK